VIILSGVLVVVAIALLVTGIVTGNSGTEFLHLDGLKLIYISIAISIVSALCLAVGVVLRRKELFGSTAPKVTTAKSKAKADRIAAKATKPVKAKARAGVTSDSATLPSSGVTADVPAETAVYVVPGRKRYHLETCRQLAGRDREELTFEEAREEGFTPCTACLPDTALAARAAGAEADAAHADAALSEESDSSAPLSAPDDATWVDIPAASETRTDLPAVDRTSTDPEPIPPADPAAEEKTSSLFDPPAKQGAGSVFDPPATEFAKDTEPAEDTGSLRDTEPAKEESTSVFDSPPAASSSLFEPVAWSGSVFDKPAETEDEPADAASSQLADAPEDVETTQNIKAVPATDTDEKPDTAEKPAGDAADDEKAPAETPAAAKAPEVEESPSVGDEKAADAGESSVTAEEDDHGDEAPVSEPAEKSAVESKADPEPVSEDAEASAEEETDAEQPAVRILSGTKRYHRPDCALIEDIGEDADDLESLSRTAAKARGCTPCLVCQPDKESSADD
jgi:hypothetical protein